MKLLIECPGRSFFVLYFLSLIEREIWRDQRRREKNNNNNKKQVSIYIDLNRKVG
jgi:hypothetical protein